MSYTPTQADDLSLPTPFSAYMAAALLDHLPFVSSGAATMELRSMLELGGNSITLRHFKEDTNATEMDDGTEVDGSKITQYADIAVPTRRRRTRGIDNHTKAALGAGGPNAVLDEFNRQSPNFWAKAMQTSLANVVAAQFKSGGALVSTHLNNDSVSSGTPVTASYAGFVDTKKLLGDNMEKLSIIMPHSRQWADMKKENATKVTYEYIRGADGAMVTDEAGRPQQAIYFDGSLVLLNNLIPTSGSGDFVVYTALLIRPGALALAFQREIESRMGFEALRNSDVLVQSAAYAAHVYGVKWTGTPADPNVGPTDAEYGTAANWTKVAPDKEIGLAAYQTNASA